MDWAIAPGPDVSCGKGRVASEQVQRLPRCECTPHRGGACTIMGRAASQALLDEVHLVVKLLEHLVLALVEHNLVLLE